MEKFFRCFLGIIGGTLRNTIIGERLEHASGLAPRLSASLGMSVDGWSQY